jgi:bifunctional non-homologous end joining protein LigD
LTKRSWAEAAFVAFDLLRLGGDDLRLRPLEARRAALQRLVAGVGGILFSEALAAEGEVVFAKACELGLEGIVSKRAGSLYRCGRSRTG